MRSTARPRAHLFRLNPLMAACGVLLGSVSVQAQETKKEDAQPVESVIVTGIRKSLDTSLDLKRSARLSNFPLALRGNGPSVNATCSGTL